MIWLSPNQSSFYFGGKAAVDFYNKKVTERREQIPTQNKNKFNEELKTLNKEGFIKWDQIIDHGLLDSINDKVSYLIKNNRNLKSFDEHYAMVADPFLNVKESFDIAFRDHLIDFATEYFNCYPGIGTFNLRRSFANKLPPKSTQLFHCDNFLQIRFQLRQVLRVQLAHCLKASSACLNRLLLQQTRFHHQLVHISTGRKPMVVNLFLLRR